MAIHSSILAWEIPWTKEPGGLQTMGSQESGMTERLSMHTCTGLYLDASSIPPSCPQGVTIKISPDTAKCPLKSKISKQSEKHHRHLYGSWKFRKIRKTDCTNTSSADRGWGNFSKTHILLEFSTGISGVRQAKFCKWGKIKARLTFCWKSKHVSHNLNLESSVKISDFLSESVFCLLTFSVLE